ncbi:MAG: plasmid recombination protein [Gallionella sp.]|nr:plasmid recombination protein [Gallionella sp.]
MSSTVSVRISPMSRRKAGGQRRHDLRDPAHVPAYVDKDKAADNSVLLTAPEPAALRSEIAANRAAAGQQKLRDDARIAYSGIITWGTDAQPVIEALDKEKQDQLYQDIAQKIAERADRPLLGLVVHRDEASPHAHFVLRGYKLDEAGKEQPLRFSKDDTADLQTVAGQVLAEHKLEITRGKPKEKRIEDGESRAKHIHRSVAELHRDLPKELEAAREKLEKNRALAEKARADLEAETAGREEKIQKRLDAYERRTAAAQAEADRLESLIPEAGQPAPVVTVTPADVKDWKPKKVGWFREETETGAADRANQSPTIRDANRLIADQQQALKFSANREERERRDKEQAQQQRDDLSRRYERGLTDQQRRQLQQQAEQIRQDNERQREEERKKQRERNKGKDKGLER